MKTAWALDEEYPDTSTDSEQCEQWREDTFAALVTRVVPELSDLTKKT